MKPTRAQPGPIHKPIDLKDPRLQVGAWLVYQRPEMSRGEDGIITSLHALPTYIHLRFGNLGGGQACSPSDLRWPT